MKILISFGVLIIIGLIGYKFFSSNSPTAQIDASLYDIPIQSIRETPMDLNQYKGKVILFVNVASKCGFTSQYEGLEALYQRYKDQDFIIIGAPSNDFGQQEPGTEEEILEFCELNYGVSFPLTEKIHVKGEEQHPLFSFLTQSNPDHSGEVKWNFSKFLVDKNGQVVDRFAPITKPLSSGVIQAIEQQLNSK